MHMNEKDYYSILGLDRSASSEDIKRAYRNLAKQFHPDMNPHPDAARRFSEIDEAHDVLIDPDSRRNYDWRLPPEPASPQPAGGQRTQSARGVPPSEYTQGWSPQPDHRPHRRTVVEHPIALAGLMAIVVMAGFFVCIFYYKYYGYGIRLDSPEAILVFAGAVALLSLLMYCYIMIRHRVASHSASFDSSIAPSAGGRRDSESAKTSPEMKALLVMVTFILVCTVILRGGLLEFMGFSGTWAYTSAFAILFVMLCVTIWAIWGTKGFRIVWSALKRSVRPRYRGKQSKRFDAPKVILIIVLIAAAAVNSGDTILNYWLVPGRCVV